MRFPAAVKLAGTAPLTVAARGACMQGDYQGTTLVDETPTATGHRRVLAFPNLAAAFAHRCAALGEGAGKCEARLDDHAAAAVEEAELAVDHEPGQTFAKVVGSVVEGEGADQHLA